jgi:hypothetical protein
MLRRVPFSLSHAGFVCALLGWIVLRWASSTVAADADLCFVCGAPINGTFYRVEDKVTFQKRNVCKECETSLPPCFVCGLPARPGLAGYQHVSDGRVLCSRDGATAVLQVDEGVKTCREVYDQISRLFARFITFPEKNVQVRMVDRVHLLELFKSAGNDYEGPNVWGFTQTRTEASRIEHQLSLLGAMPLRFFQSTCAHEYTHTWLNENLSPERRKTLSKDSEEAFCEMVAFLLMDSLGDEEAKTRILRNTYTRGQIDVFVAAERQQGFNNLVEWIKSGADDRLDRDDPNGVLKLASTRRAATPAPIAYAPPAPTPPPQYLALKAVFWDQRHPTALINDHTFAPNEEAKVRLGNTNVTVRCLAIRQNSVQIQFAGTTQIQELSLKTR